MLGVSKCCEGKPKKDLCRKCLNAYDRAMYRRRVETAKPSLEFNEVISMSWR